MKSSILIIRGFLLGINETGVLLEIKSPMVSYGTKNQGKRQVEVSTIQLILEKKKSSAVLEKVRRRPFLRKLC